MKCAKLAPAIGRHIGPALAAVQQLLPLLCWKQASAEAVDAIAYH
jgi:hypothetical protein